MSHNVSPARTRCVLADCRLTVDGPGGAPAASRSERGFDCANDKCSRTCHLGRGARPVDQDRRERARHRLRFVGVLTTRKESGSAAVESVVSIVILLFMVLAVVEIAFSLYARNVVAASAHEGARAAIERGRTTADAQAIAVETVRRAAGGLVTDLSVDVASQVLDDRSVVSVVVTGRVRPFGPVPVPMELRTSAHASGQAEVP